VLILMSLLGLASPPSGPARYVAAQSDQEVERILDHTVDETVKGLSWAIRPLARPRLEPLATACPAYQVTIQGASFRIQCEGKDPFTWKVGDSGPWTSPEGKTMQVSLKKQGAAYVLDFKGEQGGKRYTYDFSSQGLIVTQQIYADQLSEPMQWSLRYAQR